MPTLIRQHPFATYGVVALLLFLIIWVFDLQYDDGGIGTALIVSSPVWGIVYWAPQELIFQLSGGDSFPGHPIITFAAGMLICLAADFLLGKIKKADENENRENTA